MTYTRSGWLAFTLSLGCACGTSSATDAGPDRVDAAGMVDATPLNEQGSRMPLLFFAADGLALDPGVAFDIGSPADCATEPTTDCAFCGGPDPSCWSWGSSLTALAAVGCAAYGETRVAAGETRTLTDPELLGRLLWGLFSRECSGSWLPEPGRGVWVLWRQTL